MMSDGRPTAELNDDMAMWGGVECTVNRVRDKYFCQMGRSGHIDRLDDLDRFASLGLSALRYPVLWERTAALGLKDADWSWADKRLVRLRELGVRPIVGLVHHGSGPPDTHLTDERFVQGIAQFAAAVAERYPWVEYYTPINEPLTTARFSALYGIWYPHARDETAFIHALINQCRGIALAMQAIRRVQPNAKLVQTDDLGKTYSTAPLAYQAHFQNELRWLSWDLLCGRVSPGHALWEWLINRVTSVEDDLLWFVNNPCPPDIIGINYYVTSERLLDHELNRYPKRYHGGNGVDRYADIEAARALCTPGVAPLLREAWERYHLPLAITESHIDATRDDQLRWLWEIWQAALAARAEGIPVKAVTTWALLGSYDWNSLVTDDLGYYEPGAFDMRAPQPRPTAVATLVKALASGQTPTHPVLSGVGWWRRPERFIGDLASLEQDGSQGPEADDASTASPLLITGANGTLGKAFTRICKERGLAFKTLGREDMDIADTDSVARMIDRYQPWAIINAAGYVRVDDAESESERCFRENTLGPTVLAHRCVQNGVKLLTFSSDMVFDGKQQSPYVESDDISPLNVYGKSKADAERCVLEACPKALVVRTSSFFGPWDDYNFITIALRTLAAGDPFVAADDITVSPTYVPDLVHTALDLLIDDEDGIWHLTNNQPITWADLALTAARLTGVDASRLEAHGSKNLRYKAARPRYSALMSEQAVLLPTLVDGLNRYLGHYRERHGSGRI